MDSRWHLVGAASFMAVLIGVAGCGGSSSPSASKSSSGSGGTIAIGISEPLTGNDATYGIDYLDAVKVAVKQVNAAGGVNGHKIVLNIKDDQGSTSQAVTVAHELVDSNVVAVIGPELSAQALAAESVYASGNLPIYIGASNPQITERGYKNIFRLAYRDDEAGPFDAQTIRNVKHSSNVYVITDGSAYAVGLADAMEAKFKSLGGKVLGTEQITPGQNDYTAALVHAEASHANVYYYPGYAPEAAKLIKQGVQVGIKPSQWVLGGSAYDPTLLTVAGSAANGVIISGTTPPPQLEPRAKSFVTDYVAEFHMQPGEFGQWGYDTIKFLAAVFKKISYPPTRAEVIHESHALTGYVGISGPIQFKPNGDRVVAPLARLIIRNGKFELYTPSSS
jgi:branched-chain amino acid transport system substrate-binding protein